jgi:hypothetical protein
VTEIERFHENGDHDISVASSRRRTRMYIFQKQREPIEMDCLELEYLEIYYDHVFIASKRPIGVTPRLREDLGVLPPCASLGTGLLVLKRSWK